MYNHVITKVACAAVFRTAFAAATCVGGVGGIMLGLLERSAIGVLGGMFLGLVFGLTVGLAAFAGAVVFNLLVPYTGGIAVQLEPVTPDAPSHEKAIAEQSGGPPAATDV